MKDKNIDALTPDAYAARATPAAWLLLMPGGATRLGQLEAALQKQAQLLSQLQTPACGADSVPAEAAEVQLLSVEIRRLDMQLAEVSSQVQAEDKARQLLNKLSGAEHGHQHMQHDLHSFRTCIVSAVLRNALQCNRLSAHGHSCWQHFIRNMRLQ